MYEVWGLIDRKAEKIYETDDLSLACRVARDNEPRYMGVELLNITPAGFDVVDSRNGDVLAIVEGREVIYSHDGYKVKIL